MALFKLLHRNIMMEPDNGNNPAGGNAGAQTEPQGGNQNNGNGQNGGQGAQAPPQIDYDKIAQLVAGKQAVTEDSVLKGYFKQQGLSKEEMEQAINDFKQQKAANTPDVQALQQQSQQAQAAMLQSQIENKALLMHQELGVDISTIPLLMKLADLSQVVTDGTIGDEKLKEALNKVLEDVPQFKVQNQAQSQGFRQVGAGQSNAGAGSSGESKPMASKRWNRFN